MLTAFLEYARISALEEVMNNQTIARTNEEVAAYDRIIRNPAKFIHSVISCFENLSSANASILFGNNSESTVHAILCQLDDVYEAWLEEDFSSQLDENRLLGREWGNRLEGK